MALTLTVAHEDFLGHVDTVAASFPGLVPVVKGNGYGLGRTMLADLATARLGARELAVGTVHELDTGSQVRRLVLTPASAAELYPLGRNLLTDADVLTVGSLDHISVLREAGHRGPVLVKLVSSMRRYGAEVSELPAVLDALEAAGLAVYGYSIHLPLAGGDDERAAEIEAWLTHLPPNSSVYVSHLAAPRYAELRASHPDVHWRIRIGTSLWLGDKSCFHLEADVVEVRRVRAGERVGYRATVVPDDGHLVVVSAGSQHGVTPLPDGRSPFHYQRRRLSLLEPPHMHSSMLVVALDEPCPEVGRRVDVQRPLTMVRPDRVVLV